MQQSSLNVVLAQWQALPWTRYGLIVLPLLLLGLTHGVLGSAHHWQHHYIANLELYFPLALAWLSTPILIADQAPGMGRIGTALPRRWILAARVYLVWGISWIIILAGTGVMSRVWGPVPYWSGMLAVLGPAVLLSSLSVWTTILTSRSATGYLAALGLPTADLILRALGAFAVLPELQLFDVFSYRWAVAGVAWWVPKLFMLVVGTALFERAVATRAHADAEQLGR